MTEHYENVDIFLPDDEFIQLARKAHEKNMKLNDYINDILKEQIAHFQKHGTYIGEKSCNGGCKISANWEPEEPQHDVLQETTYDFIEGSELSDYELEQIVIESVRSLYRRSGFSPDNMLRWAYAYQDWFENYAGDSTIHELIQEGVEMAHNDDVDWGETPF